MRRFLCILVIFAVVFTSTGCDSKKAEIKPYSVSFKCFDTVCTITLYDNIKKSDFNAISKFIKDKCQIFDDDLNKTKKDSFVSKLNEIKFFNIYEDFEKDIFFANLDAERIKYNHFEKLYDALGYVMETANNDDVVLLIGAQGMDPASDVLKDILGH